MPYFLQTLMCLQADAMMKSHLGKYGWKRQEEADAETGIYFH